MSLTTLRVARFPMSILVAALVLVGLLLFPGPAFGVQSVTTSVTGSEFLLGSPVPGSVVINLEANEFMGTAGSNKTVVTLSVSGPQPVAFAVPLEVGNFSVAVNGATLTGTVSHNSGVTAGDFSGYGYGYGYKAGASGGAFTVDFNFTQRILLNPAPLILPQLPSTSTLTTINLAGAAGGGGGDSYGGSLPEFPEFQHVSELFAPGIPWDSKARAMDVRAISGAGSIGIAGVIMDGNPGQNDVFAQFEIGVDGGGYPWSFPIGSFNLPNATDAAGQPLDMGQVQGLAYISATRIALSGGKCLGTENPDASYDEQCDAGSDSFVAVFDLSGTPASSAALVGNAVSLGTTQAPKTAGLGLFDKRSGGVEFDNTSILVTEYQDDPWDDATIAKLSVDLTSTVSSFDTSLGFTGAGGFDGLAGDPNTLNGSGDRNRFFGVTEAPCDMDCDPARVIEFDASGMPINSYYTEGIPDGQSISGAGMITNAADSDESSMLFMISKDSKELFVSSVAAAAEAVSVGAFTNEPVAVDYDSATGRYLLPTVGEPDSSLAVLDGSFAELYRYTLTDFGRISGATFNAASGTYWVINDNGVIRKINPYAATVQTPLQTFTIGSMGEIGGLASFYDTAASKLYLYAYEAWSDQYHKIDTTTGTLSGGSMVNDQNYSDQVYPPGGASGLAFATIDGSARLIASKFNQVYFINPSNGFLLGGKTVNGTNDLQGLGTQSLLMADLGYSASTIRAGRFPGEGTKETSTVGAYTAKTTVDNTSLNGVEFTTPSVTSSAAAFTLAKLDEVTITVTTPTAGQSFTSGTVNVTGTVNDKTVSAIGLAAGLASGTIAGEDLDGTSNTTLVPDGPSHFTDSDDIAQYSTNGGSDLWHATSSMPAMKSATGTTIAAGANGVFYYGKDESLEGNYANYNTMMSSNSGILTSGLVSVTGEGTEVSFDIWYATEPTPPDNLEFGYDRKSIEFCDLTDNCTDLFYVVSFVEESMSQMMGGMGMGGGGGYGMGSQPAFVFEPPPGMLPPGVSIGKIFQFQGKTAMFVPRMLGGGLESGNAKLSRITFSLDSLIGQEGRIRIKFDSADDYNEGYEQQGVVIDNFEVTGPITTGDTHPVTNGAFDFNLEIAEGSNSTTLTAPSGVNGTADGTVTFVTILDTSAPTLTLAPVTSPTTYVSQTITGTFVELSPANLVVKINNATKIFQKTFAVGATTYSHTVGLSSGTNAISVTLTDNSLQSVTTNATVTVDNTGPVITAAFRPILSDSGVRSGDDFFVIVDADDQGGSGVATVTVDLPAGSSLTLSNGSLAPVGDLPDVILKKHSLNTFGSSSTTTHVGMSAFGNGTPVGVQQVVIDAIDLAGNTSTTTLNINVVAALADRNAYLTQGNNYIGFPLIPTDNSIAILLNQSVTNINPALIAALGGTAKLSDIIDKIYAYDSTNAGGPIFVNYSPAEGPADTFTQLAAFDGMIVNVVASVTVGATAYAVFETGTVLGSTVTVPVKWNVAGLFQKVDEELPPSKALAVGYNLWTAHATNAGLFEKPGFLRAAVVTPPGNLAVSAITRINRIDAVASSTDPGGFTAVAESRFLSAGPGDTLQLMRSYWTYMVGAVTITP